ncbi:MAG: Crossover junction endonuclease mus81 [Icmadophila ericetorum]|nr:Crossover junction endonuclease mus81 [Icmadophila ericetorum]
MAEECANPLLLGWIKEWLDFAREKNTQGIKTYKKAYESMKACPMVFNHPSEAQVLNGVGEKICKRLTEKLKEYCEQEGLPMPNPARKKAKRRSDADPVDLSPHKKARSRKQYIPALRSGAYAIMIALATLEEDEALTKTQLIELAQPYCDSSFSAPSDRSKFYTAWNSCKTLMDKDLVYTFGRPEKKYALTDSGWEIARPIRRALDGDIGTVRDASEPGSPSRRVRTGTRAGDSETERNNRQAAKSKSKKDATAVSKEPLDLAKLSTAELEAELRRRQAREAGPSSQPPARQTHIVDVPSSPPEPSELNHEHVATNTAATVHQTLRRHVSTTSIVNDTEPAPIRVRQKEATLELPIFEPIEIAAGTFTVELILDNREVRSNMDRDYLQEQLMKKGIRPITRSLELGDAMWIAKLNDLAYLSTLGEEKEELILDWIVERKRLDDLISSMKDGRFREQKFRMRRSGMKNVVYLIEEKIMTAEFAGQYLEQVQSAIASTQVVDGFFVKKTQKLDDTIRYLARMTTMLKSIYESKSLYLIPTKHFSPKTYLPLLTKLRLSHPDRTHTITLPSFSALSSKSSSLTLRDIFLKMLMCTRGLSADKSLEIQKRWTTPAAFIEAYESIGQGAVGGGGRMAGEGRLQKDERNKRKRELVSSVLENQPVGRKKVGKALSANIFEVWGVEGKRREEDGDMDED